MSSLLTLSQKSNGIRLGKFVDNGERNIVRCDPMTSVLSF